MNDNTEAIHIGGGWYAENVVSFDSHESEAAAMSDAVTVIQNEDGSWTAIASNGNEATAADLPEAIEALA